MGGFFIEMFNTYLLFVFYEILRLALSELILYFFPHIAGCSQSLVHFCWQEADTRKHSETNMKMVELLDQGCITF